MPTAKQLECLQAYYNGQRHILDDLIGTARGPGSRALRERLKAMRDKVDEQLLLATRNVVAARAREASEG